MTVGAADAGIGSGMGGGLVPAMYPPPETMRPNLYGDRWSVVAGHPLVAQVAAEVFVRGGNAIDAGVAAGLASNVVQVDMANFGGIAPILIRESGSAHVHAVAGIGRWSKTATLEKMLERHGGRLPLEGAPAIVPGAPAGWLTALARFGTMSFADVAAPAVELAQDGFVLDDRTATSLRLMGRGFTRWASSASIYWPHGRAPLPGERLRQPALARLLSELVAAEAAATGTRVERINTARRAFYEGRPAELLARWVRDHGGFMVLDDLADFEADVAPAPSLRVGSWNMASTPTWSQGPVALQILGILARSPQSAQGSSEHLHLLVEAIRRAFADRERHYAAPDRMATDIHDLLSDEHLTDLAASATAGKTTTATATAPGSGMLLSTTAVVTMDSSGATFATSPSDTLDGGPVIPELGILCSPRGVQSRLSADHPNVLAPGARPCVTPAALIGVPADDPSGGAWALACPGGDVIVQALAQVAEGMALRGCSPQAAVEAPRIAAFSFPGGFHPHPSADDVVFIETRIASDVRQSLRSLGHDVRDWPDFEFDAGSVQTIVDTRADGSPTLVSGADPRRSAYGIAR